MQVQGVALNEVGSSTVFSYTPTQMEDGRSLRTSLIPWEGRFGGATDWAMELMPFNAGAARTKDLNQFGLSLQPQAPADTFYPEMVVPGPLVSSLTLTSGTQQATKVIQATDNNGTAMFWACGRYLVRQSTTNVITTQDITGGAQNITDILVVNGEILICCGNNLAVRRRTAALVISNANFSAYSMAVVRDKLWRVGYPDTTIGNTIQNNIGWIACLGDTTTANAIVNANWTFTTPTYKIGDTSFQCVQLYDVGGTLGGKRADGFFMPDPDTKFPNIAPQMARVPDPSTVIGKAWNAFGKLYVPYQRGLLEVSPGNANDVGPGTAYLPLVGLKVLDGLEWDRMMYILALDERTGDTYVIKMIPDRNNIADGEWIFQPYAWIDTSANYGQAIGIFSAPTNPTLVFGGGAAATSANYIKLGRGSGRDVDDPNYVTASGSTYVTTGMFRPPNMDSTYVATLVSSQIWVGLTDEATDTTPIRIYYSNSDTMMPGSNATTLMTTTATAVTGDIVDSGVAIRYAAVGAQGAFFNMRAELVSTGTVQTPAILKWTAYGKMNPKMADEITVRFKVQNPMTTVGPRDMTAYTTEQQIDKLREWANEGTMLEAQIEGYETIRRDNSTKMYVLVKEVGELQTSMMPAASQGWNFNFEETIDVTLVKISYDNAEYSG